jgi:large subunit ribosomal protein L10
MLLFYCSSLNNFLVPLYLFVGLVLDDTDFKNKQRSFFMERARKQVELDQLKESFSNTDIVIVSHNKGMTVAQVTRLRNDLRKVGAKYKVTKNTLTKIAAKGTEFESLNDILVGPTALTTSKDPLAAAKAIYEFAKTSNEKLVILGGYFANNKLDAKGVETLARLPSLNELRGKIVGLLQAPGGQIARVLRAYADKAEA